MCESIEVYKLHIKEVREKYILIVNLEISKRKNDIQEAELEEL